MSRLQLKTEEASQYTTQEVVHASILKKINVSNDALQATLVEYQHIVTTHTDSRNFDANDV